jgi:CheY-like chemotaxis protein
MSDCILVVDDEPQVRELLSVKMRQRGYRVGEAANGKEAIDKLAEGGFELVISDIMMPERDGLEVIMYLKRQHPTVKIIAISAPGNEIFLNSAKALGASKIFLKPFSLEEIATAVDDLMGVREPPA